jgi:3D (Asp-Asp-Asp) domain-containing protein
MTTTELPEDPHDGQIFELPEDNFENYSGVLTIYTNNVCIGYTEKLDKIANISGMAELGRSILSERLPEGSTITVQFETIPIKSLVFINFFGWQAHKYSKKITIDWQNKYHVIHCVEITDRTGPQILYEKICVEKVKE